MKTSSKGSLLLSWQSVDVMKCESISKFSKFYSFDKISSLFQTSIEK